jgi:hypothetical protein
VWLRANRQPKVYESFWQRVMIFVARDSQVLEVELEMGFPSSMKLNMSRRCRSIHRMHRRTPAFSLDPQIHLTWPIHHKLQTIKTQATWFSMQKSF